MMTEEMKKLEEDLMAKAAGGDLVLDAFREEDEASELTDFIVNVAHTDSRHREEEKLTRFLEENPSPAASSGVSVDSIADITAPYLNAGFAVGFLVGREFRIRDMEGASDEAKEKAQEVISAIKALTTRLDILPWKDQGANA